MRAGLSRIFGYGSFDKGMCAFLECVRALQGKSINAPHCKLQGYISLYSSAGGLSPREWFLLSMSQELLSVPSPVAKRRAMGPFLTRRAAKLDHVRTVDASFSPPYRILGMPFTPPSSPNSSTPRSRLVLREHARLWRERCCHRSCTCALSEWPAAADHKIEDMSVKLQFNTYDKWTKVGVRAMNGEEMPFEWWSQGEMERVWRECETEGRGRERTGKRVFGQWRSLAHALPSV